MDSDILILDTDWFIDTLGVWPVSQPLRLGRPLYNGQESYPQCVRCSEVSLYFFYILGTDWFIDTFLGLLDR